MRFMYEVYIRSKLDYGSQVWAPIKLGEIDSLEFILRVWLKKIPTLRSFHHWERLRLLGVSSIQRRMERYIIIYLWKIFLHKVPQIEGITRRWSGLRGWKAVIPKLSKNKSVQKLRDGSFAVRAARLFNCCPQQVRNATVFNTWEFKKILDEFLGRIPD